LEVVLEPLVHPEVELGD
jgi:hypothetical protein